MKLLACFLLAALCVWGTAAFADGGGMSFTCPKTVHAGDTFTVTIDPVEGAERYAVYFWLDGHTDEPPKSLMSETPGPFTLGPVEAGSWRVQVAALDSQWAEICYNVIPVTVSDTEATGEPVRWSSGTSGYITAPGAPVSSAPASAAARLPPTSSSTAAPSSTTTPPAISTSCGRAA